MPRRRLRPGESRTKEKIVEISWQTFLNFKGKNHKDQIFDALLKINEKTGVNCQVKFGDKEKGVYEFSKDKKYLVKFTSRSAYKIELAHMFLLAEHTLSTYNHMANNAYKARYLATYSKESVGSESGSVSDIGDSEYESEEEYWEETCEICGTKKTSRTPFEVTKCRNLDMSIIENSIDKIRTLVVTTYSEFKVDDYKTNKKAFNEMMYQFNKFIDRFVKYSKFCFSYYCSLQYLLHDFTKMDLVRQYNYEEVVFLNKTLIYFCDKIETAPITSN